MDPNPMTGVLIKRGNLDTDIHTGRTLCENWLCCHTPRNYQKLSSSEQTLPHPFRDNTALMTLILNIQPPEYREMIHFHCLSHSTCGTLLWQPQKMNPPWVLLSFSHFSHVQLFVTPWTVVHQAPLSMGFSRQKYWSGLPFLSPG